ncbi:MAG TPA: alpha/beta hydrolase [Nitrososphaeraceae archaeon]
MAYSLENENIVRIPINNDSGEKIEGILNIPKSSKSLVIFAHGSGSGRYSPRNQYVSRVLNNNGLSTLLVDLLTEREERKDFVTKEYRFNIPLLGDRLIAVTDWVLNRNNQLNNLNNTLGYFGASTGSAAALIAADKRYNNISAIVSRGGRVDLALKYTSLRQIKCPTLFLVGENDHPVIEWNRQIIDKQLINVYKKKLIIIPQSSHLFEEQGKLEEVAKHASGWFRCYFQIKEKTHTNKSKNDD